MNKDYKKFWSSPSDPVHFEVDTSHEKVESMSESDTMNISNLSQGVMLSHSPICMETTGTTCDLPQVCIAYKFQEAQMYSEFTLSSIRKFLQNYKEQ